MPEPTEPKIIIDTDWKAQAQKEKERLAAKEREAAARQPSARPGAAAPSARPEPPAEPTRGASAVAGGQAAPSSPGSGEPGEGELPPADFRSILESFVSQAMMYMGAYADPQTGRPVVSLEYAKFQIDLLGVLEQKTKGNLTPEESSDLSRVLHALRMQYVELSRAVAQMQARMMKEAQAAMGKGAPGHGGVGGLAGLGDQLRVKPE